MCFLKTNFNIFPVFCILFSIFLFTSCIPELKKKEKDTFGEISDTVEIAELQDGDISEFEDVDGDFIPPSEIEGEEISIKCEGIPACKAQGLCEGKEIPTKCENGEWKCMYEYVIEGYEEPEISCDNVDNDCDGLTDEGIEEGKPLTCDDKDPCTTDDICFSEGICKGVKKTCNDNKDCTEDSCNPVTGKCDYKNIIDFCDDGDPCTIDDYCSGGECIAGSDNLCDCIQNKDCDIFEDNNLCNGTLYCDLTNAPYKCKIEEETIVTCNPVNNTECKKNVCVKKTGLCEEYNINEGGICDDKNLCTIEDRCTNGACSGIQKSCDDGNPCTKDTCNPLTGCKSSPDIGKSCEDGNPCTENDKCTFEAVCEGVEVETCSCTKTEDCALYEDGDLCNGTLYCDTNEVPFVCKIDPLSVVECDKVNDTQCRKNICVKETGLCKMQNVQDGATCSDNNLCTINDECLMGKCTGNTLNCDDANVCTDDDCDSVKGCVHINNTDQCNDGDPCTDKDQCKDAECTGEFNSKCLCSKNEDCKPFEDNNPCNGTLKCINSKCAVDPATIVTCLNEGIPQCKENICNTQTGKCEIKNFKDGSLCDNGNFCTFDDECENGECKSLIVRDCSYLNDDCNVGMCDEEIDQCFKFPKGKGTLCTDICQMCDGMGACIAKDQDFDGYMDSACGGDDCDDTSSYINPSAVEAIYLANCANAIDDDCDGLTDTQEEECLITCADITFETPSVSDIVLGEAITAEIAISPFTKFDGQGIVNTTKGSLNATKDIAVFTLPIESFIKYSNQGIPWGGITDQLPDFSTLVTLDYKNKVIKVSVGAQVQNLLRAILPGQWADTYQTYTEWPEALVYLRHIAWYAVEWAKGKQFINSDAAIDNNTTYAGLNGGSSAKIFYLGHETKECCYDKTDNHNVGKQSFTISAANLVRAYGLGLTSCDNANTATITIDGNIVAQAKDCCDGDIFSSPMMNNSYDIEMYLTRVWSGTQAMFWYGALADSVNSTITMDLNNSHPLSNRKPIKFTNLPPSTLTDNNTGPTINESDVPTATVHDGCVVQKTYNPPTGEKFYKIYFRVWSSPTSGSGHQNDFFIDGTRADNGQKERIYQGTSPDAVIFNEYDFFKNANKVYSSIDIGMASDCAPWHFNPGHYEIKLWSGIYTSGSQITLTEKDTGRLIGEGTTTSDGTLYFAIPEDVEINAKINEQPTCIIKPNITVFYDDFSNGLNKWTLFGSPSPKIETEFQGKQNVFDNNGDSWCNSGAVSNETFNFDTAFTLESDVYINPTNPEGCWLGSSIGIATVQETEGVCANQNWNTVLYVILAYDGAACWGSPSSCHYHAYLFYSFLAEDDTWESNPPCNNALVFIADDYINGWYNLKVSVGNDGIVKFFLDEKLIYASSKKIKKEALKNRKIYLGERSSGSAGKGYHDYIKLSFM